jgi:hypothetical protein
VVEVSPQADGHERLVCEARPKSTYPANPTPLGHQAVPWRAAAFRRVHIGAVEPRFARAINLVIDRCADHHVHVRISAEALVDCECQGKTMRWRRGLKAQSGNFFGHSPGHRFLCSLAKTEGERELNHQSRAGIRPTVLTLCGRPVDVGCRVACPSWHVQRNDHPHDVPAFAEPANPRNVLTRGIARPSAVTAAVADVAMKHASAPPVCLFNVTYVVARRETIAEVETEFLQALPIPGP